MQGMQYLKQNKKQLQGSFPALDTILLVDLHGFAFENLTN